MSNTNPTPVFRINMIHPLTRQYRPSEIAPLVTAIEEFWIVLDTGDMISAGIIASWIHLEQERRSRLTEPVLRAISQETLASAMDRKRKLVKARQDLLRNKMIARHTQENQAALGRARTQKVG